MNRNFKDIINLVQIVSDSIYNLKQCQFSNTNQQTEIEDMLPNVRKLCSLKSKNQKLVTCLSLSTMCLLIMASIVFITIISITPIIILNLGQINTGQRDLILKPQIQFMNSTKVQQLSKQTVMPRLKTVIEVENMQFGQGWFFDFTKQRQNHLGTIAGNQPKNHNFVYVHSGFSFSAGKKINLKILEIGFVNTMLNYIQVSNLHNKDQIYNELFKIMQVQIQGDFQIKQVFDTASGKFPIGKVNRFIYLDMTYAFQQMINATIKKHSDYLNLTINNSKFVQYINNPQYFQLGQFSTQATINIPDRIKRYSSSDYQGTYDYLGSFASKVIGSIGIFPVSSSMPIAKNWIAMSYFGMFIGVILKLIIVSLFMVSAIMMNNMLTMTVNQRQFQMAVYKTIGANRFFVIFVVLIDSLKYVLVANLIAFPFAYIILTFAGDLFESFFGFKYDIYPTPQAIFGGLFIGILVPLISSLSPIASILNNRLVEHLNPIRNKTQAIHTQIYVDGKQFPYGKLAFGILATTFGLMIYYLLPKGLINQDITLLMFVFFTILLGLLIGLILISISFQYLIEKMLAYALLFWINATDFILILKNLSAHRFKNRRSSILYALSVALIVFLSVGIQIQIQTIYNEMLKNHASFVQIKGGNLDREYYDSLLSSTAGVQDWSYITAELSEVLFKRYQVQSVMISDHAKLYFATNQIYGVSPNFLNTFYSKIISVDKTDSSPPYDPYSYLYSNQGANTSTLSKFMAQKFNIFDSQNHQYLINYYWKDKVLRIPQNYSSIFSKRVGLRYNPFTSKSQIGISIDRFIELAGLSSYIDVPYTKIKVKLKDPSQSMKISNELQKSMSLKNSNTIWQYSELHGTISRIQDLLTNVLNILLVIVLVISFFSLVTTSYINILNQTTQIGILLCLGYDKIRLYKIYILQTFIVVVNSCLIGVAVGWFVAWMMGLQRQLFSDYPIQVQINGLSIIVISALISSLLSTYKPLKQLFSVSISQVLNYA